MTFRLAVIGGSEGNGHPWSWSAICNGYDAAEMARCPYPAIPAYLDERRFPDDRLPGVAVTKVWMPDRAEAEAIARAALVAEVVDDLAEAAVEVDGVLLARDDAATRLELVPPLLATGLPVYVDKPLAVDVATAEALFAQERWPGQLFTCTALRYAAELSPDVADLGEVRHVAGIVPKAWDTYAVHAVEPALRLLAGRAGAPTVSALGGDGGAATAAVRWPSGHSATFTAAGPLAAPIALLAVGTEASRWLPFSDSFSAFRAGLAAFLDGAGERRRMIPQEETMEVVHILEGGRRG